MKVCPECGHPLRDSDGYCPSCGHRVQSRMAGRTRAVLAVATILLALVLHFAIYLTTAKTIEFTVSSTAGWLATHVVLGRNSIVHIGYVSGAWSVDKSNYVTIGPEGYDQQTDTQIWNPSLCKLLQNASYGTLLGKIGDGSVFMVGRDRWLLAENAGEIYLSINDAAACLADNQGQITVRITAGTP